MQNPTLTVSSIGIAPMLAAAIGAGLLLWSTASMTLGISLAGGLLALAAGASYWERLAIRAALDQAAAERAATVAKPDMMPYTQSLHEVADPPWRAGRSISTSHACKPKVQGRN